MAGGRAILAGFAALLAVPVALEAQTSGQAQTQSGGGYYDMGDYTYFNQPTAPTPTPTPTPKPSVTSAPALSVTQAPTQSTAQAAVRAQAVQQPSAQIQGQPYVFPKGDLDKARADAKALAKPARASAASLPTSTPLTSVPGYSPAANPAEAYADDPDGLTAAGNAAVGSNEAWKMVTDPDRVGDHVRERNDAWIPTTLPGVEGARDWARDTLGMGQGTSHVYELPRGERATLPISGRLSSNMGGRIDPVTGQPGHHHRGVDIAAALGTEIRAPASGRVVKNDFQGGGAGNYLVLQHGDGSQSKYFHMQDRSAFPVGSNVEAGSVLGRVGSTGKSTGPHLHYELWKDGRPVDPKRFQLRNVQE